jgi:GNAT superfamily N-acetyltransferase
VPEKRAVCNVRSVSRVFARPFEAGDVPAAGALLAQRHARHRLSCPLLSPRYEDVAAATAEVATAFQMTGASGAFAVRDGKPVGYLLGSSKSREPWGPNIWVESAGHAAADGETLRDLYAVAAAGWVESGLTAHYALVPATDEELVRAWFRLGFGQQSCHALRGLPAHASFSTAGLIIRRAARQDIPALAELEVELPRHQRRAPTFSAAIVPPAAQAAAEWAEDFDDSGYTTFVAERDGTVVGSAVGCALEKSGSHTSLARPDNAGFLGFAAVFPSDRGRGAGRALGESVLEWAGQAGFDCVVTDWRVTNLLSSRTWPTLGFAESFLRLHRLIGY